MADNMPTLRNDLAQVARKARLTSAVDDVDVIIARLVEAREQIAASQDPYAANVALTRLQNPVKEGFEAVNNDLKAVSKTQKEFGKALDRSFPASALPTEHDAMQPHSALINRAIAMHLLREGHFEVARIFMNEARDLAEVGAPSASTPRDSADADADDGDDDLAMSGAETDFSGRSISNLTQVESQFLQDKFQRMYSILQHIESYDLAPAIRWARDNSDALEERGSNLEFELCKLQFIWLAKTSDAVASSPSDEEDQEEEEESDENDEDEDDENSGAAAEAGANVTEDLTAAFDYAQANFHRFHARHLPEIQRLAAAVVFASNIRESPYARIFDTSHAFVDVSASFTREFCSLLGLSADSPLYVAATAGVIALPRLIKFIGATRQKKTEWTTASEMAFETPLPASMTYHPIFVCPVSKEQTTDENPPMRLPCGHVLANDSLRNLAKGSKFKCPYCPVEGQLRDARRIFL